MEKLVKTVIMSHLTNQNLLSEKQHGFVSNKACITNLIGASDFLTSNIAKKNSVDMILLDFAKAFDKVPHKRLILKLSNYSIQGELLDWIRSFLFGRKQRVVLGSNISD